MKFYCAKNIYIPKQNYPDCILFHRNVAKLFFTLRLTPESNETEQATLETSLLDWDCEKL